MDRMVFQSVSQETPWPLVVIVFRRKRRWPAGATFKDHAQAPFENLAHRHAIARGIGFSFPE